MNESKKENLCTLCRVVEGELPSHIIYEDNTYLGLLDPYPNSEGMSLVLPKAHLPSDIFTLSEKDYHGLLSATKKVAHKIKTGLGVQRVAVVSEGTGINHAHMKLYPLHGLKENFEETWADKKAYFESYPGYITTLQGPEADREVLAYIANKIFMAKP